MRLHYALSLGSNLAPQLHLPEALRGLRSVGRLRAISRVFRTAPLGPVQQPDFHNLALCLESSLSPLFLLERCQRLELSLGRVRTERWGARTIDIDLLLCHPFCTLTHPRLTLPHPRLGQRAFVVLPLLEICDALPPSVRRALEAAAGALSDQRAEPLGEVAEVYLRGPEA